MNKYVVALIKYGSAFLVCVGIFFGVISIRNIYAETELINIIRDLCDGFIIPGVVLIGAGALVFVANLGSFNGIGYAVKHAVLMLIPFSKKKHETYAEYVSKHKEVKGYYFLFIVGGVFLTAGIVFLCIWFYLDGQAA